MIAGQGWANIDSNRNGTPTVKRFQLLIVCNKFIAHRFFCQDQNEKIYYMANCLCFLAR